MVPSAGRPRSGPRMILLLLPLLALAGFCVGARRRDGSGPGRLAEGLIRWSAVALIGTEALSLVRCLSPIWIAGFWLVVAGAVFWFVHRSEASVDFERDTQSRDSPSQRLLVVSIVVVFALLALTAWFAPPSAQDVVTYHLPRVLHWAQAGTLAPFPTHDTRQLYHPPFAEILDLHTMLLSGGDRWVGALRVLFLVGTATAAARVAQQLAGPDQAEHAPHDRTRALVAAALAVTAPTVVVLVHGGKNSPIAGFFLLACCSHLLSCWTRPSARDALGAGLSLGLALATKTTCYLFAAPLLVALCGAWVVLHRMRAVRLVALVALLLNAGHLVRNQTVYGHPLVDPARAEVLSVEEKGIASAVSNSLRFATLHLGTPSAAWNAGVESVVRGAHDRLGLDADDPRTTAHRGTYSVGDSFLLNSRTGSPLHFLAIVVALALVFVRRGLRSNKRVLLYSLALIAAAVLFAASLRWTTAIGRLHAPLLVLGAPLVALAMNTRPRTSTALALLALVAAVPWVVQCNRRHLVGRGDVFEIPRRKLLYESLDGELGELADEAARWIGAHGLRAVGLLPEDRSHAEYPLWLTLRDHVPDVRVEHVGVRGAPGELTSSPPYLGFQPDVVLWIAARDEAKRAPYPADVLIDGTPFQREFENARVALYTRTTEP